MGDQENAFASPPDTQLFMLFSDLLQQVEELNNHEEVELRAKIEALGLEVTKVSSKSKKNLDEEEIAKELDQLSAKLDDADEIMSSAIAANPQMKSFLSTTTADVRMPDIAESSDEKRKLTASLEVEDDNLL
ncbi:Ecotropic viral integration site protein [Heracleum sosnowskyi]|uniref:Ecotropic viral integration site protein n=1 Tax=Heracleum sosnowskyi TaxID=360622 RepID=A0AAD8HCW0_9APIA|nr:Ecotropic viral integration site protein [Heracleum sosnowskyi]